MTGQEYEREYRHALHQLRSQGCHVHAPKTTEGRRLVVVNGLPCSDWEVFREAYGEQTAEMIAKEWARPPSRARHAKAS